MNCINLRLCGSKDFPYAGSFQMCSSQDMPEGCAEGTIFKECVTNKQYLGKIGFSEEELPYLKDRLHTLVGDMANGDCDTITVIYRAFDKREIKDANDVDRIIKMAQEHEDNPILEIQVKGINEEELEYTLHIRPDKVETLTTKNPCS